MVLERAYAINLFVCFFVIQSEKGGATSMANPLYQDPYLEEDLSKYWTQGQP